MLEATLTGATLRPLTRRVSWAQQSMPGRSPYWHLQRCGSQHRDERGCADKLGFVADGMYELLADNVPADRIGALIAHPALWRKMAKLRNGHHERQYAADRAGGRGEVGEALHDGAPFTGGNTCKAVLGDWRNYLFGVRRTSPCASCPRASWAATYRSACWSTHAATLCLRGPRASARLKASRSPSRCSRLHTCSAGLSRAVTRVPASNHGSRRVPAIIHDALLHAAPTRSRRRAIGGALFQQEG